jgi:Zn-dependent peptidase ImmA (M78 family)
MGTSDHHFRLNGDESWLIRFTALKGQAYGITYTRKSKRPRIVIHDALRGRHRLTILLHELLHAIFPQADEEVIEQAGKDLSKVLTTLYTITPRE